MTEEIDSAPNQTEDNIDDPRYEVKWKKKSQSASPPPESVTIVADNIEALQLELDEARERIRDLQDKWQRSAADLVNLRRRTEQEKDEVEQFASMLLVADLLPVLDNFERALATIPGNLAMLTWIHGMMLIERHLLALLEQRGLAAIDAQGQPFSPHYHEALGERETDEAEPGTVVQVYQKGYTMHGRVLRPALVEISRAPTAPDITESVSEADIVEVVEEAQTENTGQ